MSAHMDGLAALSAAFSGTILTSEDAGYDDARRVHNGLIDKHPRVIARCLNTADIVDAVNYGRIEGLEISVRGGGHNPAGRAVTDGGLMIDLSLMKGIHVDPGTKTARAQGGVTWNEFNRATALHGLAVTGGVVSSTGIAGLTLGGGLGWGMSSYGMAVDNVRSIELVTADGQVLTASDEENSDLFWACRGGGGNFGVAASFEYDLYSLSIVTGGLIAHPLSAAGDVLRFYREFTEDVGDDLTVFCGLVHAPDGSGAKLAVFVVCHVGDPEEAARDLEPLKSFGEPAMMEVGLMPYPVVNTLLDAGFPQGALNYWKSAFLSGLSDEFINTAIGRFATCPSPMTGMVVEHFHGEVTRVEPTATAFPHRERGYNLLIAGEWMDPAETEENTLWVKETYEALAPHFSGGRYVNYLGDDEASDAVRSSYGVVYDRLVDVKRRYDPDNLFHLNQNIDPGG
jgi:FAD/FMN-containing dehydrogenase